MDFIANNIIVGTQYVVPFINNSLDVDCSL